MAVIDPVNYNRLRRDVGASELVIPDELADEYFEEAAEEYPLNEKKAFAYARVIALKGIRASAAMLGKYAENQSSEDLTKVFDNLTVMLNEAIAKVDTLPDITPTGVTGEVFFFGVASGRRGQ